jgi:hypothetical protein
MLLVEHEWLQPGDFTTLTRSVTPPNSSSRPKASASTKSSASSSSRRWSGRRQPDAGRAAARHQSRPGALPYREVRPRRHEVLGRRRCRLRPRFPDGQDRTRRRSNDPLGDAAHQQVRHAPRPCVPITIRSISCAPRIRRWNRPACR